MENMLAEVLNLKFSDLKKAKEIFESLPTEVDLMKTNRFGLDFDLSFDFGFDICGYLLESVAFSFERKYLSRRKYCFHPTVEWDFSNSSFNLIPTAREKIEELAAEGCEIAQFILCYS